MDYIGVELSEDEYGLYQDLEYMCDHPEVGYRVLMYYVINSGRVFTHRQVMLLQVLEDVILDNPSRLININFTIH